MALNRVLSMNPKTVRDVERNLFDRLLLLIVIRDFLVCKTSFP